eukprot:TRINITY_DN11705_c0_g1_i1.p1 TRINITY_DN11705_c0_g1~~TRINITY_DN11705_c0_g1_i1.p1  ORF type:complete len:433 (-),score=59.17 TRINITY_DN11705_c0_g1_i1:1107-2372(-)
MKQIYVFFLFIFLINIMVSIFFISPFMEIKRKIFNDITEDMIIDEKMIIDVIPERDPLIEKCEGFLFDERVRCYLGDKEMVSLEHVKAYEAQIVDFKIPVPVQVSINADWIPLEMKHYKDYCPKNCELVFQNDTNADLVWIGGCAAKPMKIRHPGQILVGNCGEARTGSGSKYWSATIKNVNVSGSYEEVDRLWTSYFAVEYAPPQWDVRNISRSLEAMLYVPKKEDLEENPIAFLHNNCGSKRGKFIKEILNISPETVDCYGKCYRNKELPSKWSMEKNYFWPENEGFRQVQKTIIAKEYKIMASLENTFGRNYFTEKRFQTLLAGSIPLVWKNDDSLAYLPHPKSGIFPEDFDSAAEFNNYMVNQFDKDFYKYHEWKKERVFNTHFVSVLFHGFSHSPCRMCELAAYYKQHKTIPSVNT